MADVVRLALCCCFDVAVVVVVDGCARGGFCVDEGTSTILR